MTTIYPPLTKDEELKRALSKIYALLLKLAAEVENSATPSQVNSKDEKTQKTTDVPLQQNIPPSAL